MSYTRKNVWDLITESGAWADEILWYARGVAAMKARALADRTSWRFYATIHGFSAPFWKSVGYLSDTDKLPAQQDQKTFWNQCQHGSWYFLPWHRGYLLGFEAIIRAEVTALNGPKDWALPYWNYFKDGQAVLPPAFASPDWPDGQGDNPLFVEQRYGPNNDGNVFVPLSQVNLNAMNEPEFTGVASGGSPGFGGIDTGFSHGGMTHGSLETQPHDWVHGLVGGGTQTKPGLMSYPQTAGLDPIFWLHHANIDRLWEVWRQNPPTHVDPADADWLKGPANIGQRQFAMPMPDGTIWNFTPAEVASLTGLGYGYDDLLAAASTAGGAADAGERVRRLRGGAEAGTVPGAGAGLASDEGVPVVANGTNVELVGASGVVPVRGSEVRAAVQLDRSPLAKVSSSLAAAAMEADTGREPPAPDRVFLNLENVRGLNDAVAFQVYIGLPEGADPPDHPERLAGSIALFGVSHASDVNDEHGGQGLNFVLEITHIVDALHLNNSLTADVLDVRLVPVRAVPAEEQVQIGRISIFRQGR